MGQRRGLHPNFIIRAPDGRHMAVALDATDYVAGEVKVVGPKGATHLLDIEGLWQAAQFMEEIRQRAHPVTEGVEAAGGTTYD